MLTTLLLISASNALGQSPQDRIFDLAGRIQDQIYRSSAPTSELIEAERLLQQSLRLIYGGGGQVSYLFRCEPVQAQGRNLAQILKVQTKSSNGTSSQNLARINFLIECEDLTSKLHKRCSGNSSCQVLYCQADNPSRQTLNSTLYEILIKPFSPPQLNRVDSFHYRLDCESYAD